MLPQKVPKLVFLDIDGPLVPFERMLKKRRPPVFCLEALENVTQVVYETGASVIISSDWRKGREAAAFSSMFEKMKFPLPISGLTRNLSPQPRDAEIVDYVQFIARTHSINPSEISFVVIDDVPMSDRRIAPRVVLVDPMKGFSSANADEAIRILNL